VPGWKEAEEGRVSANDVSVRVPVQAPAGAPSATSVPEAPAPEAPALSIVVPVHDEQDNIAPLLAELRAALDGQMDYEVLYVDDGSRDATAAMLREAAGAHPRLRVLTHARSFGQSAALMSGVRAARAPWIATLDGDGQNDPRDILRLYELVRAPDTQSDLALVVGHRRRRRDTWLKRVSSRVANAVRGGLLGDRTPDTGCGLKLVRREVYLRLPYFDHMHRFLPALVQAAGGETLSVAVNHRERLRGRSHYGLHDRLWAGIVDLIGVLWLRRRLRGAAARPREDVQERQ
jgi:dolichol-phosphate mannosyltransferase